MPRIRAENIESHKELTRQQILDAAEQLFLSQGYSRTTLAEIAAIVRVGRTTLYEYFRDKEEIVVSLVEDGLPRVVDGLIGGIPKELSYRERLGELVVRTLEFIADEANLGTLIMREVPKLSHEAQERVRRAHGRLEDEVVRICTEATEAGEFRDLDPELAGRVVNAMVMGASRVLLGEAEPKQHVHEAADTLLAVLFEGLEQ